MLSHLPLAGLCAALTFASLTARAAEERPFLSPFPPHTGGTLTYERLASVIRTKNLTSIEQVLAGLPEGFRDNYVLMYRSRSLQHASFNSPRVILAESDGSFVMT